MSFLIGYGMWHSISISHTKDITISIPLSFYGSAPADSTLHAPEIITVHLAGKRSALQGINSDDLALHINANGLHVGANALTVDAQNLFLPNGVTVLDYAPAPIVISVASTCAQPLLPESVL
jgi:hypothetical protein